MRPGISYTQQGNPYMQNPGSFAFGRAQPKSSEKQQGPLAEPPKQSNQAAQKQFGSAQASGDYSAYSPASGGYQAYDQANAYGRQAPRSTQMRYRPSEAQPEPSRGGVARWQDLFPKPPEKQSPPLVMPAEEYNRLTPQEKFEIGTQPGVTIDGRGNVRQDLEKVRSQYGTRIGQEGGMMSMDFVDSDRDGVDDRYQAGPGQKPGAPAPMPGGSPGYGGMPSQYLPPSPQQPAQPRMPYGGGTQQRGGQSSQVIQPMAPAPPQQYFFPMNGQGPQFYNQRDAFINNINTSLGQQMMQNFGGAQPVAPQINIPQLWAQAGEMAANGWTNPLAALIGNV